MSKQSRLNKAKAEKAKANQGGQTWQSHRHDSQRGAQERGEGVARKDDKSGRGRE
jgi:hypothetical protein